MIRALFSNRTTYLGESSPVPSCMVRYDRRLWTAVCQCSDLRSGHDYDDQQLIAIDARHAFDIPHAHTAVPYNQLFP
ncbi:unnamed protein product [Strongylus vulgaris]|uniref:Uncharacterized protein n=1 Tax=Strongylus vulgaris TaxID=40348 RepID=A0A3P7IHN9_STRVU|nr:unnamed protein product [Strongylus vulgaris]